MTKIAIPPVLVPIVTGQGTITPAWYRYFLDLTQSAAVPAVQLSDQTLLGLSVPDAQNEVAQAFPSELIADAQQLALPPMFVGYGDGQSDAVQLAPPLFVADSAQQSYEFPPSPLPDHTLNIWEIAGLAGPDEAANGAAPLDGVTFASSPGVYRAGVDGALMIVGGTVSDVSLSRDGTTFVATGQIAGFVPASRGDLVRVTYTVAPTITFIPR